ncbi:MAG: BrnT family toxin [Elusimicrobiota bacterium]
MRFVLDREAAVWLRDFIPDPDNFDWDKGNLTKNRKHGVQVEEIESLFYQERFVFAGRIVEPAHDEWRGLVLGRSDLGRHLALIFTRRGERLRPISCRPMRSGERRLYEASVQEGA